MDARKTTLKEKEALSLAQNVDEIYASQGKQVVHIDRTLLVGFDEASYTKVLK